MFRVFRFKKILGLLTGALFLIQTLASAVPDWSFPAVAPAIVTEAGIIHVPARWGTVRDYSLAPAAGRIIFHVQNAHGNYQAQKGIENILEYLSRRFGARDLFLEGAAGPLDPSVMRFFPEESLNLKVADLLMRHGEFTGAERFLLTQGAGYGIEDAALYRKNFELFRETAAGQKAAREFFSRADREIRALEGRVFSRELKRFAGEWRKFRSLSGGDGLLRFSAVLRRYGRRYLGLDPADPRQQENFGTIARVLKLREIEKRINPVRAESEKRELLDFLSGKIDLSLEAALASLGASGRAGKSRANPRYLLEKISEQASGAGLDFRQYPNFTLLAESLIFQTEIRSPRFFAEAESVSEKIFSVLAVRPEEKELLELIRTLERLKKLLSLELSREEFKKIASSPALSPREWLDRLCRLDAGRTCPPMEDAAVEKLFLAASGFYRAACDREKHFLANVLSVMKRRGLRTAVLVTGGFHESGMRDLFRREGISYVSIGPRFSKVRQGHAAYWRSLAGETTLLETSHLEKALRELPPAMRQALVGRELAGRDRVLDLEAARLVSAASLGAKPNGDGNFADFLRRKIREEKEALQKFRAPAAAFLERWPPSGENDPEAAWIAEEDAEKRARQIKAFHEAPEIENDLRRVLEEKIRFAGIRRDPGHRSEPELETRRLEEVERQVILKAVVRSGGNISQAARRIGFAAGTVYRKLRSYGLEDGQAHGADFARNKLGGALLPEEEKISGSYEEAEKAEILWALWIHDGDINKAAGVLGVDPRQGFTRGLRKKLLEWGIPAAAGAEKERWERVRDGMIRNLMVRREQWGTVFRHESRDRLAERAGLLKTGLKNRPASFEVIAYAIALYAEAARRALADPVIDPQILTYVGGEPREKQVEAALLLLSNRTTVRMLPSEGKTLTVGLAAFLKAVSGRRVEVHDWSMLLSARDAQVEGAILHQLGMKTAVVLGRHALAFAEKGKLYPHLKQIRGADTLKTMQSVFRDYDVVYGPYHQMIFLWMGDWAAVNGDKVHPAESPEAVIVEEGDTPLLDNLNKPLAFFKELFRLGELPDLIYQIIYGYARSLIDEQTSGRALYEATSRRVTLFKGRREGALRVLRSKLGVVEGALEYLEGFDLLDLLHAALEAQLIYHEKKHYLVKRERGPAHHGKILLINENTGEISEDERLSRGLHSFLEIKHGLAIQKEGNVNLVMTPYEFYSRIRFFSAVMGYLGENDETRLNRLYDMYVKIVEPSHPHRRMDLESEYFRTEEEKFRAIAEVTARVHRLTGRPILINARQPFGAELISQRIAELGIIPADGLRVIDGQNPKENIRDWNRMGDAGSVTVSAQMASRGQEIKLEASLYEDPVPVGINGETAPVAGLFVIGSHRGNSERVEEQLKTRTARRGKPGVTWTVDHLENNRYLEDYVPDELAEFLADPRRDFHGEKTRKIELPLLFELQRLRYLRQLNEEFALTGPLFRALADAQFHYSAVARRRLTQGKKIPAPNFFTSFVNAAYYAISTHNHGEFNALLQDFNRRLIQLASEVEPEAVPLAQSLGEETRNPESVVRVARPHKQGGVTEGFLFVADAEARHWAMKELGLSENGPGHRGEAFEAFRRGELDGEILKRLNFRERKEKESNILLVLFPGILEARDPLAEKFQAGDALILIRGPRGEAMDPLIRAANRSGVRVRTLPDALVSPSRIRVLARESGIPGLPVIVSSSGETRDLAAGFRGRKFKFDDAGLQGRVDKAAAVGLLRKIADYPGKFREIGLEQRDGYWQIGGAFADFIEEIYRDTRAARLRAAAA
jgi:preprotein translocase subunit SecA/transposase-like protein